MDARRLLNRYDEMDQRDRRRAMQHIFSLKGYGDQLLLCFFFMCLIICVCGFIFAFSFVCVVCCLCVVSSRLVFFVVIVFLMSFNFTIFFVCSIS